MRCLPKVGLQTLRINSIYMNFIISRVAAAELTKTCNIRMIRKVINHINILNSALWWIFIEYHMVFPSQGDG